MEHGFHLRRRCARCRGSLSASAVTTEASVSVCTTGMSIIIPLMLSSPLPSTPHTFMPAVYHRRRGWWGGGVHNDNLQNGSLTKHSKAPLAIAEPHLFSKQEACLFSMPGHRGKGDVPFTASWGRCGALPAAGVPRAC